MEEHIYTTTYGLDVKVEPISVILLQKLSGAVSKEFERDGKNLTPPEYCVELPGSDKQCYVHDKDTIKDAGTSDEDKEAWRVYQETLNEYNTVLSERMLGAIIMDQPIKYEKGWEKKLEWLGIEIPEDELDLKVLYVTTRLLRVSEDIQGYMFKVMEISAGTANEEAIAAAKAMFRGEA